VIKWPFLKFKCFPNNLVNIFLVLGESTLVTLILPSTNAWHVLKMKCPLVPTLVGISLFETPYHILHHAMLLHGIVPFKCGLLLLVLPWEPLLWEGLCPLVLSYARLEVNIQKHCWWSFSILWCCSCGDHFIHKYI
jgi:hypothetical protein